MFLGAITVSYNLPGVASGPEARRQDDLRHLPRQGQDLERRRDQGAEPGRRRCPSTAITVIHRSDSSGTTSGFTSFLAAVDPEFKSKVGEGKDVQWPTGTGAKGNAGVAGRGPADGRRSRLRRAGLRAAAQLHLRLGEEQVRQLRRADPRLDERGGAKASTVPANLGIKIINPPAAGAYPITSQTFIVVNKDLCKAGIPGGEAAAKGVVTFLDYGLGAGSVDPRPGRLRRAARRNPGQVQGSGRRACSATAPRSAARPRCSPAADRIDNGRWRQHRFPAASARSSSARRWRACPTGCCKLRADGAGGADPGADRLLLHPPRRRGETGVRQVRRPRLHVRQRLERERRTVRRPAAGGGDAHHLGAGAADRRARSPWRRRSTPPSSARCACAPR